MCNESAKLENEAGFASRRRGIGVYVQLDYSKCQRTKETGGEERVRTERVPTGIGENKKQERVPTERVPTV